MVVVLAYAFSEEPFELSEPMLNGTALQQRHVIAALTNMMPLKGLQSTSVQTMDWSSLPGTCEGGKLAQA
jgi:hypothetical protein